MSEHIYLMGSEDVKSAGRTMSAAGETMKRAAESIDYTFAEQRRFMDDWLIRFQTALELVAPPIEEK